MRLSVNPRSPKPVYLQVVDGLKEAVAKGLLAQGDRVPSVRELAAELTINHNTVARAYQELERDGVIEVVRGQGTFIAAARPAADRAARVEAVAARMREMLIEAHHLQLTEEDLLALFRTTLAEWRDERRRARS